MMMMMMIMIMIMIMMIMMMILMMIYTNKTHYIYNMCVCVSLPKSIVHCHNVPLHVCNMLSYLPYCL